MPATLFKKWLPQIFRIIDVGDHGPTQSGSAQKKRCIEEQTKFFKRPVLISR
jgi:hypothetical protein